MHLEVFQVWSSLDIGLLYEQRWKDRASTSVLCVWILSLPTQWWSLVWQWLALFCYVHLSPCVGLSSNSRCLCLACNFLSFVLWQMLALLCAPSESKFQGVCFYCVCWTLECSCVVRSFLANLTSQALIQVFMLLLDVLYISLLVNHLWVVDYSLSWK